MKVKHLYYKDLQIVEALLHRDENVTRQYFYRHCYPLFKSIYDNYYTDTKSCIEFINEMYLLVLSPSKVTGRCQLENYRGESSLTSWLKTVCLYYCYRKFGHKIRMSIVEKLPNSDNEEDDDRIFDKAYSYELDITSMNSNDVETILGLMPNERYVKLIRMRYLEMMSNESTAKALGITMDNYYNVHKRAKTQFENILKKEEYNG